MIYLKKSGQGIGLDKFNDIEIMGILEEELFSSPREAINKIIHSTYVGHDIRHDSTKPYYIPSLQLLGNKGKNQWAAEIYLLPFCKVLYYMILPFKMTEQAKGNETPFFDIIYFYFKEIKSRFFIGAISNYEN